MAFRIVGVKTNYSTKKIVVFCCCFFKRGCTCTCGTPPGYGLDYIDLTNLYMKHPSSAQQSLCLWKKGCCLNRKPRLSMMAHDRWNYTVTHPHPPPSTHTRSYALIFMEGIHVSFCHIFIFNKNLHYDYVISNSL